VTAIARIGCPRIACGGNGQYGEKPYQPGEISRRIFAAHHFHGHRDTALPALRLHEAAIMDVISQIEKRIGYQALPAVGDVSRIVAVPAVEWFVFLERFSRRHRGWLGTLHGVARDLPLTRVPSEPLEAIALERCDSDSLVRVTLANGVSLCAPQPRAIRVQQTDEGAEAALEVETADGALIRLAFRATALPEQLDGVASGELNPRRH
jgi:hypothetical protein